MGTGIHKSQVLDLHLLFKENLELQSTVEHHETISKNLWNYRIFNGINPAEILCIIWYFCILGGAGKNAAGPKSNVAYGYTTMPFSYNSCFLKFVVRQNNHYHLKLHISIMMSVILDDSLL